MHVDPFLAFLYGWNKIKTELKWIFKAAFGWLRFRKPVQSQLFTVTGKTHWSEFLQFCSKLFNKLADYVRRIQFTVIFKLSFLSSITCVIRSIILDILWYCLTISINIYIQSWIPQWSKRFFWCLKIVWKDRFS